jgi:predicted RecB family nuclease
MVTNDIFISLLHCKRKAFLRAAGTPGRAADIETVLLDLGRIYRRQALDGFLARYREQNVVHDPPCLETALKSRPQVIVNANVAADGLSSLIQAAERAERTGQRSASSYGPILFILNEVVTRADKLLLAFNALALSLVQGVLPPIGKIVHGSSHREMKVKIEPLLGEVRKLVVQIQAAQAEGAAPRVNLNRHCSACEFRDGCRKVAEETDDLSLLRGLSEKEIVKLRSRGITTVTQFSHCYRPGKRGKRKTGKARKHDPALQALAAREKKVYVLDSPEVPHSSVALYLDVEGIPDRNFYYLIGLVVVRDGACTEYAFWADDQSQEKANWNTCARVIEESGDYTLYHYGSYEQHFLDRMAKAGDEAAAAVERIRARSCNVLAAIYSHIYFPTLSNGLKDIGTILGARWSTTNASGIQSLVWRLAWEVEKEESLKQQLLAYNREDCLALRRVTEFMLSVCAGATSGDDGPTVASAQDIPRREGYHFGKVDFFCPELPKSTSAPTRITSAKKSTYAPLQKSGRASSGSNVPARDDSR